MIPTDTAARLAAARRGDLLAEADARRAARQARVALARLPGQRHRVRIRPIRPTDADWLGEFFSRLSAQSRWLRFLSPKPGLTRAELRYFTDVDHRDHEALVAVHRLDGGIGVARYVRSVSDPGCAEVAVTVADDWHGRGIGTQLVRRLAERARSEGIVHFTALMSVENHRARRLLAQAGGPVAVTSRDGDVIAYQVSLATDAAVGPQIPAQRRRPEPAPASPCAALPC